jgi:hypothetical protein
MLGSQHLTRKASFDEAVSQKLKGDKVWTTE